MNKLINSPQNNGKTEPLAYIDGTMKAGFDGIGIRTYRAPGRVYNFNPIVGNKDLERDVKNALKDSDLEVYDLYSFYLQPEIEWDVIKPALEFGAEIGAKYCLVIGDDPDFNRMVNSMGRLLELLTPLGLKAVFESHATNIAAPEVVMRPIQKCVDFVNACKPGYVGICTDPRQYNREEGGFDSLKPLGMNRELFPYIQLNDRAEHHMYQGVLPGEGFVPLYDYLDCFPADIDISVEAQIPPGGVYTGAEWCKIQVERIKHFLTRYHASRAAK